MKQKYLVIYEDTVIGEFSEKEDAKTFFMITAAFGDKGDQYYLAEITEGVEIA